MRGSKTTKQQTSTSQVSNVVTTTNIDDRDFVTIDDRDLTTIDASQTLTTINDSRDLSSSWSDSSVTETNITDARQDQSQSLVNAAGGVQFLNSEGARIEVTDLGAIESAGALASQAVDVVSRVVDRNTELTGDVLASIRAGAADYAEFLAAERANMRDILQAAQPDTETLKKMFQQVVLAGLVLGGVLLWRRR